MVQPTTHACCPPKVADLKDSQFDLIVVGGGSAAFAAAIKADELKARVAVVEHDTIGGTCLNRGCVPSKYFIRAAELYHLMQQPPMPGLSAKGVRLDWKALMSKKEQLLEDGRKAKYWDILEAHPKITYLSGKAELLSTTELRVNGRRTLTASKFVIATGASPFIPPIEGIGQVKYLTSTEALELKTLPKSMLVIGANAVGLELAQMFAHVGVKVTIHEVAGRIAPYEEPEVSDALAKYLIEEGLTICTCTKVLKARQDGKQIIVIAQMPDGSLKEFIAESLLIATGRRPNTQGLGLERAGVALTKRGGIQVDDEMKTATPNIWAAGDCVDCACPSQFVYVAALQGAVAAQNAIDDCCHRKVDYPVIPRAIFTTPEVASVGLTEEQAKAQGLKVRTSVLDFHWIPRAWLSLDERGLIKMVAEEDTGRILGIHLVAPHAGELIHEATLALRQRLTIQDLIDTLHVYPTLSEALRICAQGFFKDATKLSCCAE